ncbi:MAG: DMT family transporter [Rhodobacteraceae bacterium]|nr:DMT family transporter [Paracoccaceae bacterium]
MNRRGAALLVMLGAVFMSSVGVFLRMIESADGFQILFYRSIALTALIAGIICLRRRLPLSAAIRSLDRQDVVVGFFLSLAFTFYIFAILNTSVASTLFILTAAPLLAASMAWIWIGEKPHPFTWAAMIMTSGGVFLMIGDGLSSGRSLGNFFALMTGLCFALMLVFARRGRKTDILGGTLIAGVLSGIYGVVWSLFFGNGLAVEAGDFWLIVAMGGLAIGPGIACVTWGTPYLPAAEVSLLVLLESALGPVWVWLFGFEKISRLEFVGGTIVFAAVIALSLFTGRRQIH